MANNKQPAAEDDSQAELARIEQQVDELMDKSIPDAKKRAEPSILAPAPASTIEPSNVTESSQGSEKSSPMATAPEVNDPSLLLKEDEKGVEALLSPVEPKKTISGAEVDRESAAAITSAVDDLKTDDMVDDIVRHEGDELIAVQDEARFQAEAALVRQPNWKDKLKDAAASWWQNRWARYGTIAAVLLLVVGLSAVPATRYMALNSVGIRATASMTILDNTTQLPLKNAEVQIAEQTSKTNGNGVVKLEHLKLGSQSLIVRQVGFAPITQTVVVGLGSNPLGQFSLRAVGTQFHFQLKDFLSGKAVTQAEVSSGQAVAKADKQGRVILTVDKLDSDNLTATVSADGYRKEQVSLKAGGQPQVELGLVPAAKEVYISKQSGKYDTYSIDVDGKNKKLLLAASGYENDSNVLVSNQDGSKAALVSRRDNQHNADGYGLQALTIIDVSNGDTLVLDHSEQIRLISWDKDTLVYVKIKAGASAGNPERYQLMSYNLSSAARLQLATANYFNSIAVVQGEIYYAAENNYSGGVSQLAKIDADGTGKQVLLDHQDVWQISRLGYDTIASSSMDGNYTYTVGDKQPTKSTDQNDMNTNRFYLDSSDGKKSLWIDSRDGKGVLLSYDVQTKKDTTVTTQSGLTPPLRWLTNATVIYRVSTQSEIADYAVSLNGGTAHKITDITGTSGFGL